MTISLDEVRLYGYHGVLDQERKVGAEYELNIELILDPPSGCITDELTDTVSYADLFTLACDEFNKPCQLLEHLVYNIADAVLLRWKAVKRVSAKVSKLAPPIPGCLGRASVALTLSRD
ncbi:MAG: dihydroneopterin aldolase [Muribaculaceae bacterium]|nr:dihydroneopterin aldolase [Muribaculaceae bacterium]